MRRLAPLLLVAAATGCGASDTVEGYLSDLDARHAITASVLVARDGKVLVNLETTDAFGISTRLAELAAR